MSTPVAPARSENHCAHCKHTQPTNTVTTQVTDMDTYALYDTESMGVDINVLVRVFL